MRTKRTDVMVGVDLGSKAEPDKQRGVELRRDEWAELINSDEHGGSILPMMMLYHEHDPDPEMRPNSIGYRAVAGQP